MCTHAGSDRFCWLPQKKFMGGGGECVPPQNWGQTLGDALPWWPQLIIGLIEGPNLHDEQTNTLHLSMSAWAQAV